MPKSVIKINYVINYVDLSVYLFNIFIHNSAFQFVLQFWSNSPLFLTHPVISANDYSCLI